MIIISEFQIFFESFLVLLKIIREFILSLIFNFRYLMHMDKANENVISCAL